MRMCEHRGREWGTHSGGSRAGQEHRLAWNVIRSVPSPYRDFNQTSSTLRQGEDTLQVQQGQEGQPASGTGWKFNSSVTSLLTFMPNRSPPGLWVKTALDL